MVFNPLIPQPNDFIGQSQSQIQQNYQEISTQFSQDHILDADEETTSGKHKKISYNEQSGDPVTIADEAAFYTKDTSGQPEIYYAPESADPVIQFTKGGVWVPGLKVEANVTFDMSGNIIEEPDPIPGNPNRRRTLSSNVTSVVQNSGATVSSWTITFTSAISTADYFWVFGAVLRPVTKTVPVDLSKNTPMVFTPTNTVTYSNSVTTTSLSVSGYNISNAAVDILARTLRLNVIIYTVG